MAYGQGWTYNEDDAAGHGNKIKVLTLTHKKGSAWLRKHAHVNEILVQILGVDRTFNE